MAHLHSAGTLHGVVRMGQLKHGIRFCMQVLLQRHVRCCAEQGGKGLRMEEACPAL